MRSIVVAMVVGLVLCMVAPVSVMGQDTLSLPNLSAANVYAFDPETGEVILELNSDERVAIGSVTKVATALVVLDYLELSDEVVISSADMVPAGYSSMMLQPGDTLTVEQLLTGLIVVSGGDASMALARTVGADIRGNDDSAAAVAAFVDAMNEKASELGLSDTRFANPDGQDDENAWSTAHDVALLFAAYMEDPDLAGLAGAGSYTFASVGPEATPYEGYTTNQLLGQYGVTAAKTGSETNAGGCLVLQRDAASGGGTEIIAVLGADLEYDETWTPTIDARWNDAMALMDTIDAEWTPGQFLADSSSDARNESAVGQVDQAVATERVDGPVGFVTQAADPPLAMATTESDSIPTGAGQITVESDVATTKTPSQVKPIVVATVTGGVLSMAAAYTWVRTGRQWSS